MTRAKQVMAQEYDNRKECDGPVASSFYDGHAQVGAGLGARAGISGRKS